MEPAPPDVWCAIVASLFGSWQRAGYPARQGEQRSRAECLRERVKFEELSGHGLNRITGHHRFGNYAAVPNKSVTHSRADNNQNNGIA